MKSNYCGPCIVPCKFHLIFYFTFKGRSLCREDRNVVTKLRRGKVLLNGKPYEKTNFKFGDVITYTCKRGFKLTGPSKVTCSGIGKWKPWDKGTPSCSKCSVF